MVVVKGVEGDYIMMKGMGNRQGVVEKGANGIDLTEKGVGLESCMEVVAGNVWR